MTSTAHEMHQELTSSLKSGGNNSNSNGSGYGSAPETGAIVTFYILSIYTN